jgi:hypothetical protein
MGRHHQFFSDPFNLRNQFLLTRDPAVRETNVIEIKHTKEEILLKAATPDGCATTAALFGPLTGNTNAGR